MASAAAPSAPAIKDTWLNTTLPTFIGSIGKSGPLSRTSGWAAAPDRETAAEKAPDNAAGGEDTPAQTTPQKTPASAAKRQPRRRTKRTHLGKAAVESGVQLMEEFTVDEPPAVFHTPPRATPPTNARDAPPGGNAGKGQDDLATKYYDAQNTTPSSTPGPGLLGFLG